MATFSLKLGWSFFVLVCLCFCISTSHFWVAYSFEKCICSYVFKTPPSCSLNSKHKSTLSFLERVGGPCSSYPSACVLVLSAGWNHRGSHQWRQRIYCGSHIICDCPSSPSCQDSFVMSDTLNMLMLHAYYNIRSFLTCFFEFSPYVNHTLMCQTSILLQKVYTSLVCFYVIILIFGYHK